MVGWLEWHIAADPEHRDGLKSVLGATCSISLLS